MYKTKYIKVKVKCDCGYKGVETVPDYIYFPRICPRCKNKEKSLNLDHDNPAKT